MPSTIAAGTTAGTAIAIAGDTTGNLAFQTNGTTTAMTINTSQQVGIGTTSPTAPLDIQADSGSGAINIRGRVSGDIGSLNFYNNANTTQQFFIQSRAAYTQLNTVANINMLFATNNTERMRILSTGTVLVGKTAVADGTSGLTFYGGATGSIGLGTTGSAGTNQLEFFRGTEGSLTRVGFVQTTGSATSYNTSSDYRLKENIAPMTGALATVAQLNPVTYKWKSDGSDGQGFIAHELQAVVPECVTGEKDAVESYTDEEGNEQTRPVYQGVDTSFLVATLTAAIQELKAELDATKAEVQALKGVA